MNEKKPPDYPTSERPMVDLLAALQRSIAQAKAERRSEAADAAPTSGADVRPDERGGA